MKRKKLLFVFTLTLLLFVSGCDVDYTLEMKKDTFEENFSFMGEKAEYTRKGSTDSGKEEMVDILYQIESGVSDIEKKVLYEFNHVIYKYNRRFQITEIEFWPSFSRMCFDSLEALYTKDDTITLKSSSFDACYNKYKELDNISITFKTDFEVVETNGEKKEDAYTWNINKDTKEKNIYIKVKYKQEEINKVNPKEEKKKKNIGPIFFWIFLIALITAGIYFLGKRIQKNNQFD